MLEKCYFGIILLYIKYKKLEAINSLKYKGL